MSLTRSLILIGACFVLTATVARANPYRIPRAASRRALVVGRSCQSLLGSSSYECRVESEFGGSFTDCFTFSPSFFKFTLFPLQFGGDLSCTCEASGPFRHPRFNSSRTFDCAGGFGANFRGTVTTDGQKITSGQVNSFGSSFVFQCVRATLPCFGSASRAFVDGPPDLLK
jgi:hypothetical protein